VYIARIATPLAYPLEKKRKGKENLASYSACFVPSVDFAGGSFYGLV